MKTIASSSKLILTISLLMLGSIAAMAGSDPVDKVAQGRRLFEHNCAHCHGDDARGDEGPDLHGLRKSDERLRKIILEGIKGEMPAFGKKFKDDDVAALTAFLRTLKD